MKAFAYLITPDSPEHLRTFFPATRFIPLALRKLFSRDTWPFQVYKIKDLEGYFIALPMFFRQTEEQAMEAVEKVLLAADIAKTLNAGIMGLGGYTCLLCDRNYTALRTLKMSVTSGSTLVAWTVFEGIYRMSRIKGMDLAKSTVAIINAASAIGSLCARKLSACSGKIILNGSPEVEPRLGQLKEAILHFSPLEIIIEPDIHAAAKNADIVVFTDTIPQAPLELEDVRSGMIICDASISRSFAAKAKYRADIYVMAAGLIKMPKPLKFSVNLGLPAGIIPASMAETMLLATEKKFTNYSLGDNINLDKMEEIADIAARHGFEVWVPQAPVL